MGYVIYLTDHSFLIDKDHVIPAVRSEIGENSFDEDTPYEDALTELGSMFEFWGFQTDITNPEDGLRIDGWEGKTTEEDEFLTRLAPYVTAGSYLSWEGEDGNLWQYRFDGTSSTTVDGHAAFHPVIDYETLRDTIRDGLNADSGDAEREALAEAGQMLGLTMNDDGQYQ